MSELELTGLSESSRSAIERIIADLKSYRCTVKGAVDDALKVLSDEEFHFPFLENCPGRNPGNLGREEILRLFFQHILSCKYRDDDIREYMEDYRLGLIKGVKWNCLDSEKTCQTCRKYASQDLYGLGPGVYPPDKVPPVAHVGCMCFLSAKLPVAETEGTERSIRNPLLDIFPERKKGKRMLSLKVILVFVIPIILIVIIAMLFV